MGSIDPSCDAWPLWQEVNWLSFRRSVMQWMDSMGYAAWCKQAEQTAGSGGARSKVKGKQLRDPELGKANSTFDHGGPNPITEGGPTLLYSCLRKC